MSTSIIVALGLMAVPFIAAALVVEAGYYAGQALAMHSFGEWCDNCVQSMVTQFNAARAENVLLRGYLHTHGICAACGRILVDGVCPFCAGQVDIRSK